MKLEQAIEQARKLWGPKGYACPSSPAFPRVSVGYLKPGSKRAEIFVALGWGDDFKQAFVDAQEREATLQEFEARKGL